MGVTDAPSWLLSAFVRSALAVGATAPKEEIERTARRLVERWQSPGRAYHNVRHLKDVLARVDELAQETHHPDLVRLAAWYHGAVFSAAAQTAYARRGGEDEAAGAELARTELTALGVPDKAVERVHQLIRRLCRHDAGPDDIDALALSDADLGILAVEPQRYAAYRAAVREEYAHLPLRDYLEARVAILTKLLGRPRLFVSPFSAAWEEPARENLSAELHRLRAELAALDGDHPAASVADDVRAEVRAGHAAGPWRTADVLPQAGHDGEPADGRPTAPADGVPPTASPASSGRVRSEVSAAPAGGSAGAGRAAPVGNAAATRTSAASAVDAGVDRNLPSVERGPEPPPARRGREPFFPRTWDEDASSARTRPPRDPAPAPRRQDGAVEAPAGIERDPDFLAPRPRDKDKDRREKDKDRRDKDRPEKDKERRGWRRRGEDASPTPPPADDASTASLFRPPPDLPRS
jgi:predicted metal-dependent HD superfamily phosphohydrolase